MRFIYQDKRMGVEMRGSAPETEPLIIRSGDDPREALNNLKTGLSKSVPPVRGDTSYVCLIYRISGERFEAGVYPVIEEETDTFRRLRNNDRRRRSNL